MPWLGPYAPSDNEESDDFVRHQLLLANAVSGFFGCAFTSCVTQFRDDLLGVALFPDRRGELHAICCQRDSDHGQWRLTGWARSVPGWIPYGDDSRLGAAVAGPVAETQSLIPMRIGDLTYRIDWDIEKP